MNARFIDPGAQLLFDKLRAVVGTDELGSAVFGHERWWIQVNNLGTLNDGEFDEIDSVEVSVSPSSLGADFERVINRSIFGFDEIPTQFLRCKFRLLDEQAPSLLHP